MYISMRFPGGREKAFTLSYDDGVVNDIRLMGIFDKYGLKCTFNLNSACFSDRDYDDYSSVHRRLTLERAKELYCGSGHEIAVHGETHAYFNLLPEVLCTREILNDRISLEREFGGIIRGCAYPYGTFDEKSKRILKDCGIVYSRTVKSTHGFDIPRDWLELNPTMHHADTEGKAIIERFVSEEPRPERDPWLFYLWGHSYEFDFNNNWEIIEDIAKKVSGRDEIWYATNIEIYDYVQAYRSLIFSAEGEKVYNPSALTLCFALADKLYEIKPGETVDL